MKIIIRLCIVIGLFLITISTLSGQEKLRIMFYNTENLFDCKDDPHTNDEEFLPNSLHHWTYFRYRAKLDKIAKVITAVGEWQTPTLVGLCEVENDSVIYDLINRSALRTQLYRYVITHSSDRRGIDVALLYQRDQFKLLSANSYKVPLDHPTRDILHVTGHVINGDTLDVFVCHFPSRLGGEMETNHLRNIAARILKEKADSVLLKRQHPGVIIMGDFNDYPDSESLYKTLGAKSPTDTLAVYTNLMYPYLKDSESGSHKYQAEWGILDQFIVNVSLLKSGRSQILGQKAHIFNAPFLLEEDLKYGGVRPFRTYSGPRYLGGYSDHLPIWMDLVLKR